MSILSRMRTRVSADGGFTIIEVLIAMMILLIGAIATFQALAAATNNTQRAKESQVMLDVAQQEMEKIRNLDYSQIALTSAPSSAASSLDPDSRVNGGQFALNRDGSNAAQMVINGGSLYGGGFVSGGTVNPGSVVSTPTSIGDTQVRIWRFVVWQNDAQCGTCAGNQDYKRVVIAVRPEQRGNQHYQRPYMEIQSDFIDPQKSALTDPASGPSGVVTAQQFWLTDTSCSASGHTTRVDITADHLLHNTLGTCASGQKTGTTPGAPDALLTSSPPDPAPDDPAVPGVFDYANDFYLEPSPNTDKGVQLKRPTTNGCNYSPGGSNPEAQIHRWVTDPMPATFNMTGKVTLEFYTRAINDASYSGKLCVWLFKRHETGSPPIAIDTALADSSTGNAYWTFSQATWPRLTSSDPLVWTKVRIPMTFNPSSTSGSGGQQQGTISAGDRLGIALGSERAGTTFDAGIQILYDHPNDPTRIEVDTTTPIDAG